MQSIRKYGAFALALGLLPATVSAHHMTDGRVPATLYEGLLSGLAHPVIGLDHFATLVALGLLAAGLSQGPRILYGFLAASLAGSALHLARVGLPAPEVAIPLFIVCIGGLLSLRPRHGFAAAIVVALGAGVCHGYVYAETIGGAGLIPLAAYLIGLTAIQFAVATGARAAAHAVARRLGSSSGWWSRTAGAALSLGALVLLAKVTHVIG